MQNKGHYTVQGIVAIGTILKQICHFLLMINSVASL